MGELAAWDLDGTIRPGSLLADAIAHGIQQGFIDSSDYENPATPTYAEVNNFVKAITNRSRHDFASVVEWLSDGARSQAYPWALERLESQHKSGMHTLVLSHAPDFLVRAFARGLGINHGKGSYFHTSSLVFSGKAITLQKTSALRRYMREHHFDEIAFAAGDSEADVPVLEKAASATVVNPLPHLAELAIARSWEIVETTR